MFGAICGDVLGSRYEFFTTKDYGFALCPEDSTITDDTVLTAAVASAILRGRGFAAELKAWYAASSRENFGPRFQAWAMTEEGVVGDSAGNGACMRVAAIAGLAGSLDRALDLAADSARTSHAHPDAVRAAMATVAAMRLAQEGWTQAAMAEVVARAFDYDLFTPLDAYRHLYGFEPLALHTVYPSLRGVVEATSFEDGIRRVISMGGDADTMAATAGGPLEAFFPVPDDIRAFVMARLPLPIRQVLAAYDEAVARIPPSRTDPARVPGVIAAAIERGLALPASPPSWWRRVAKGAVGGWRGAA